MTGVEGRFNEAAMWQALTNIADQIGADYTDAHLLRLTNNAVFALPAAGVVVRITRTHRLHARAHKVAALGAWFEEVDAPTIRLADGIEQPVADGNLLATVWRYVKPHEPSPDACDLGTALHAFHGLGVPPLPLPEWDPIGDARSRITDAEDLDDDDRDYLLAWCDRLEPRLTEFAASVQPGLVHGDAHEGNLLRDATGRVLLCDFDATCTGPWQVDLAPAPANEARFGPYGGHSKLAAAYGYDITQDPAWPILQQARELKMIAAAAPLLASAPGVAAEFQLRLESVRTDDHTVRWTSFGDLPR
ncbi:aminoglycoside phosphotransferase family protein [Virgisporangium aurantiacum]|uniref:Aminoglycoside phosphotransferase n=1 Tax=Virgisporangium aurantiacum TaxID=175570 RepID=A0A8J3Z2H5_9ACTN|nr:aminoglycoside phosphotransferase family protein [Virgisporangium aurantiacum]GIJ56374.1 aminoglycoside phosphotransferase [Virgisporangium aurantiacum]